MINIEDIFIREAIADFKTYINTNPTLKIPFKYFPLRLIEDIIPNIVDRSNKGIDKVTNQDSQTNKRTNIKV